MNFLISDTGVYIATISLPDYVNEYSILTVNKLARNFDDTDVNDTFI